MNLSELAKEIEAIQATGTLETVARDVTHDSRQAGPGTVFVAVPGAKVDGYRFIGQAFERGAAGVISELPSPSLSADDAAGRGWIQVKDARAALPRAAAAVHGHPSRRLRLVGVTGTNGKTTTAHLIDSVIRTAERTSAMLGTITYRIGSESAAAHNTTPEASDIQRMLARAVAAGCRSAVIEVSSHAIELRRADALSFEAAIFTNLTRDHLDFHNTMEDYFAVKKRLFDGSLDTNLKASVINADDEYGRELVRCAKGEVTTYGLGSAAVATDGFQLDTGGLSFTARTPVGLIDIRSRLVGRPHVYNILAAVAASLALGFDLRTIAQGIAECENVPGRFERVSINGSQPGAFTVIVDYAHTDDALKKVLETAREVAGEGGRVIVVFGCGGDRDRTKRAPMGEIAAMGSDEVIVTSDNPRSEDPETIISDIEAGLIKSQRPYLKLTDRREAIFRAIGDAREGDVVLIAGKGHETYQIIGNTTAHFDDREVAREAMAATASQ